MVRWGYKVTPALCGLQEWFCPLFSSPSGSALGSYVLHMRRAALTTGCSARAFPVLLGRDGLRPVMNSKGESTAQSSSLYMELPPWSNLCSRAPGLWGWCWACPETTPRPLFFPCGLLLLTSPYKVASEGTLSTSAAQESLSLPLHLGNPP